MTKTESKTIKQVTIDVKTTFKYRHAYRVSLRPGFPFDPRTKGRDHIKAWLVEVRVQNRGNRFIANDALILCKGDDKKPDLTYIHAIYNPMVEQSTMIELAKAFFKDLGYVVYDKVLEKRKDLVKSALSKLTDEEKEALKYNVKFEDEESSDEEEEEDDEDM